MHTYCDVVFNSIMMHGLLKGFSVTYPSQMDNLPQESSMIRQRVKQLEMLLRPKSVRLWYL